MSLFDRITSDLTAAMKARDEARVSALRMCKTALMNAAIEARASGQEFTDSAVVTCLQTHAKRIRESIVEYERGNREDLAAAARREVAVVEEYLPAQCSEEEIRSTVERVRAATGLTAVGPLMGAVMKELQGRADGNAVRRVVGMVLTK